MQNGPEPVKIRQVTTDDEREQVFRFRYRVYVVAMQRRQKHADHAAQTVREPLDLEACIMAAFRGKEVLATLRANCIADPAAASYRRFYRVELFAGVPLEQIMITTKLMVAPELRRTAIPLRMIGAMARVFHYRRGCTIDLLDCNKPLIPFFRKYGYCSYVGWRFHPEYGTVRPMFCAARDLAHLEAVGSPFARIAAEHGYTACAHSRALRLRLARE